MEITGWRCTVNRCGSWWQHLLLLGGRQDGSRGCLGQGPSEATSPTGQPCSHHPHFPSQTTAGQWWMWAAEALLSLYCPTLQQGRKKAFILPQTGQQTARKLVSEPRKARPQWPNMWHRTLESSPSWADLPPPVTTSLLRRHLPQLETPQHVLYIRNTISRPMGQERNAANSSRSRR